MVEGEGKGGRSRRVRDPEFQGVSVLSQHHSAVSHGATIIGIIKGMRDTPHPITLKALRETQDGLTFTDTLVRDRGG